METGLQTKTLKGFTMKLRKEWESSNYKETWMNFSFTFFSFLVAGFFACLLAFLPSSLFLPVSVSLSLSLRENYKSMFGSGIASEVPLTQDWDSLYLDGCHHRFALGKIWSSETKTEKVKMPRSWRLYSCWPSGYLQEDCCFVCRGSRQSEFWIRVLQVLNLWRFCYGGQHQKWLSSPRLGFGWVGEQNEAWVVLSLRMLSQNGGDCSYGQFIEKSLEVRTERLSGGDQVC